MSSCIKILLIAKQFYTMSALLKLYFSMFNLKGTSITEIVHKIVTKRQ